MERLEGSLIEFYKAAWEVVDPAPYQHNWHLDAIAEHLEAVSYGQIRKLLINLPPRHSKTLLCSVMWNAWMWCKEPDPEYPLIGPGGRFLALSYAENLAMDNSVLTQRLVTSPWYQDRWGHRVKLAHDQANKHKFDTTVGGTRISSSFKGTVTGRGAGIRIYDDPHSMAEVESQVVREGVIKLYESTLKSRITDPRTSAEVLVAQRGHQNDLSAKFLEQKGVVHLNLPAEYDSARHCVTVLGWEDPRTEDGELLWADRFGPEELEQYKSNPFEWSAQWQQQPIVRGGAILKEEWWQVYEVPADGAYDFEPDFVLASLDTAFTTNTENDYSALTVWAVYDDPKTNRRRILLVDAWKKRLELHGARTERIDGESDIEYSRRAQANWGLCEWIAFTCTRRRVHRLVVENTARGHDVVKEIQRVHGSRAWGVVPENLGGGDKISRVHSVVDLFTDEMIFAPGEWVCAKHNVGHCKTCPDETKTLRWREWSDMVIKECSEFPHGTHDDIVDTVSMALRHLRNHNLAIRRQERSFLDEQSALYRPPEKSLYQV